MSINPTTDWSKQLQSGGLKPTTDEMLCLGRRACGRGFLYLDPAGERIANKQQIKRLKKLGIPPMWEEVRISTDPHSHIQAIGRDKKGRKQYIYHEQWTALRQAEKFNRLAAFGQALPDVRKQCRALLQTKGWNRDKVLALMILILDDTGIRIGNRQYLERNDTHGLTTLRRKHLDIEDDTLFFHYRGKSKQQREVQIENEALIHYIKQAAEQPGYEIFRYRSNGHWENVDSDDINSFIQQQLGEDYSSKYFRTWVACRTAVEQWPAAQAIVAENPRRRLMTTLIRRVAERLGNTPSVCRKYYIHPSLKTQLAQTNLKLPKNINEITLPLEALTPAEQLVLKWIS